MKDLILTEKPSVARDFAKALTCAHKGRYYESSDYVITNAIGHLLELAEPAHYNPEWQKWSLGSLPIIPENYSYLPKRETKGQLELIKQKIKEADCKRIIIATDAGREGELIARLILSYCGIIDFSNVYRFWVSAALTPEVIHAGLSRMEPARKYDDLYAVGMHRQLSDWIVGINLSRLLSVKLGDVFSFGRVQTAVLSIIVRRHQEIANFRPVDFFQGEGEFNKDGKIFKGLLHADDKTSFDSRNFLDNEVGKLKGQSSGIIKRVEEKKVVKQPPLLYNLTALQRAGNSQYGYSAKKTLDICQALYEKHKCVSYPRTPSRVLGESNVPLIEELFGELGKIHPDVLRFSKVVAGDRRVFNDVKLEDHHALIPLAPLPESASEDEGNIYDLILKTLGAVFAPAYVYNSLSVLVGVEGAVFHVRGKEVLDLGWRGIIRKGEDDQDLPVLREGDPVIFTGCKILAKKTKSKPAFTDASILAAMEHPEKHTSLDELDYHFERDMGVGTQATRAAILETLLRRKYILRQGKKLIPTEKGLHFHASIEKIPELKKITDVSETARWEIKLKEDPLIFYGETLKEVTKIIDIAKNTQLTTYSSGDKNPEKHILSRCPKCKKGEIRPGAKNYYCSEYKSGCDFVFWKKNFGVIIKEDVIAKLLSGGTTKKLKLKRKDGSGFEAALKLGEDYKLTFAPRK